MTIAPIVVFTASGSARDLSRAIEEYVRRHGSLQATVVPWESGPQGLSMAVTSVRADGWAIEHTNLGTITLTELDQAHTRIEMVGQDLDHPERAGLADLLTGFGRQMQHRFEARTDSDHASG